MKKEVLIGKKMSRRRLLIKLFITLAITIIIAAGMMNLCQQYPFFQETPYALKGMRISLIILVIIMFFAIMGSGESLKQYMIITSNYLCYYSQETFISQIKAAFQTLLGQDITAKICIPISQIDSMTLSYTDCHMLWFYQNGHSIIFCFHLKDGTVLKIQPDNLYFIKENVLEGLQFLEQYILINDPYGLIKALKNKDMRFGDYVEKVIIHGKD